MQRWLSQITIAGTVLAQQHGLQESTAIQHQLTQLLLLLMMMMMLTAPVAALLHPADPAAAGMWLGGLQRVASAHAALFNCLGNVLQDECVALMFSGKEWGFLSAQVQLL
jgi:aromatic ring hydroxylase